MEGKIFDPLRRRWVAHTPEEDVRQWMISVLQKDWEIPAGVMGSEVAMKYGPAHAGLDGTVRRKTFRADILVYDRAGEPLLLVECKRPEVDLDRYVLEQAQRYDAVLGVRYILVTNGPKTLFLGRSGDRFRFLSRKMTYEQLLHG